MSLRLFWASLAVVAYTYLLFPLLVLARALVRPRPVRSGDVEPPVSVIVAAHNERAAIAARVRNLLAQEYPRERMEVIVASDGSDDGTAAEARQAGAHVLELPREGKAAALNAAVQAASGDVLVFTDANSEYAPDAIRALVRPFADEAVGGVAGDQRYLPAGASTASVNRGEMRYWSFDRLLKSGESRAGSVISATGAIYAVRRSLFQPVPAGVTDDFATSTAVIAQGRRLVFAREAIAYEPVSRSGGDEFGRKVRIMTRGLRGVVLRRELLDPRRHGFYSLQLVSHKLLRRLMVFPLLALAVCTTRLHRRGRLYRVAALVQALVYGGGAAGLAGGRSRSRLLAAPAFFCLVNAAALGASWNLIRGKRIDRWEPRRDQP